MIIISCYIILRIIASVALTLGEIVSVGVLVVGIKFQSVSIFVMIGNIVAHAIIIILKIVFVALVVIKVWL